MLFLIKKQAGISEGMVTGTATKLSPATAGYLNKLLELARRNMRPFYVLVFSLV